MNAIAAEASESLRRLAEPIPAGDRIKSQISRAARAAGLTYWRAFDLWYGKARRIDAEEIEAIRAARQRHLSRPVPRTMGEQLARLSELEIEVAALRAALSAEIASRSQEGVNARLR